MNRTTLQIAEFIASKYKSCSLEEAAKIQAQMSIDFSECTVSEFQRSIMQVLESEGERRLGA